MHTRSRVDGRSHSESAAETHPGDAKGRRGPAPWRIIWGVGGSTEPIAHPIALVIPARVCAAGRVKVARSDSLYTDVNSDKGISQLDWSSLNGQVGGTQ
eukprot:6399674-Prymnesium_polylepis.2